MQKSILEGGFEHAEIVQIGIENEKMQRELRDLGIDFYKTHRVYQRVL
jgi:arginase family enzyme